MRHRMYVSGTFGIAPLVGRERAKGVVVNTHFTTGTCIPNNALSDWMARCVIRALLMHTCLRLPYP